MSMYIVLNQKFSPYLNSNLSFLITYGKFLSLQLHQLYKTKQLTIIPQVHVRYELAIIISYPWNKWEWNKNKTNYFY